MKLTFSCKSLLAVSVYISLSNATGRVVELSGISFWAPAAPITSIPVPDGVFGSTQDSLIPTTVVTEDSVLTANGFSAKVADFKSRDDVFSDDFLSSIYIQYNRSVTKQEQGKFSYGNSIVSYSLGSDAFIPNGPYFLSSTGALYAAYRLYGDHNDAFYETTVMEKEGSNYVLSAGVAGQNLAVAVPSRLYYTPYVLAPPCKRLRHWK
jgi:hypothetical protein